MCWSRPPGPASQAIDAAVGTLPGVKASAALVGINAGPVTAEGLQDQDATTVASLDGRYGRTVDIPKMLAGRLPSPSAPREVAVNQIGAQQLNLHVGSVLTMAAEDNSPHPRLVKLTEHVVGIFVTRGSVLPVTYLDRDATVLASIALYRQLGPNYEAFDGAYVTLKPGTSAGHVHRGRGEPGQAGTRAPAARCSPPTRRRRRRPSSG